MKTMENKLEKSDTFEILETKVIKLLENARSQIVTNINTTMVYTNFEIGRYIVEYEQNGKDRAEYGKFVLKNLSQKLSNRFGRGYSEDNLSNMRKFYLCYQNEQISETVSRKFTLQGQIIEKPEDLIKDPYILEFTGLPELPVYSESELEQRLIDNLQKFLLELGKGFTFVGRQVRLTFDEEHYFVDLVFYNRLLRAFVLIDLKRGKLKHQDLGQMQMYVNYYDRFVKLEDENPTVGILLCADKNDSVVEITLPKDNSQIFASKYQTVLPSKDTLKKLLQDKLLGEEK